MNITNINKEKIETCQSQFHAALDDYKKAEIAYKLNPEIEQYRENLSANELHLTAVNKDLFVLTNNIQFNIDTINKKINELNAKISEERGLWEHLGFSYQQLKGVGKGSNVMIDNSKELYKSQYISNWGIFIGILILSIVIYLVFGKKANEINPVE